MKKIEELLLASQSKFRLALCESAGIPVRGVKSYCDEHLVTDPVPSKLALLRSEAKGAGVRDITENSIVISSDQVLEFEAKYYGNCRPFGDLLALQPANRFQVAQIISDFTFTIVPVIKFITYSVSIKKI